MREILYILPIMLLVLLFGCQNSSGTTITEIDTKELERLLQNEDDNHDYFFMDVREVHEYNEAHIKQMVNIPLSVLESSYEQVPNGKTVVIICRSGSRSLQAANLLKDLGYENLVNVRGGMLDWDGEINN
ncbi:rhodanese-like domain-containing protein [Evansella sp. AB-rgal1]|uniref:rhodanese-like domain-containing protein n=1 Tax=Evansella sp. AB-rgal1 TaxID=3242696 RepID=UPI00359E40DB